VCAVVCDIADAAAVAGAHAQVVAALGRIDILVNNAGVLNNHKLDATTAADWRRVMAANLDGALFWSQAVVPAMKALGWGRIVNVSSLAAKTGGLTAGTAYSVSKGALSALTFSLARELAGFGLTANAIAPAYVRTPMLTEQFDETQRQALLEQIPVGRFCEPEEFAQGVCFLASPLSGFITGEVIDLNGGLLMD
jgi:3-oxoacyl-[acyl-carrier protein] reductase